MRKLTALFFICLTTSPTLSYEPVPFSINTKKWSHVLDDHFISITINPTDLLQGKVFGLTMNSTAAILKGLAPAYVRIGSADTAKYTFKKSRYPNDMVKPEDEYTVTETHWMVFNEVLQSAGLNVIVCLNAAHRIEGTKKWDTRNSLELISFSDSQGYNLTWQLGYEVQSGDDLSGIQFGKDLNRLRTILNAFPRYQNSKLIGPDIKIVHKKEDVDFWNDVLLEAGPTLDALTWHPRWPQPSKMKVSDNSELGYEFPVDYLEWDKAQLNKILQKSIFKNAVWIGETKRESTGTFAEGLIWARRLVLAAKLGVEVVMKQPNLMDITHPKPEYWIALLHKKLLGKSVLETRSVVNNTDLTVISHCTNPYFWTDKPEKLQDGPITIYGVNMGGLEQKIHIKGPAWTGRSQLLFQYVLTAGSDPDSIFSQMSYLNGEPLMMTDEGILPDIVPKIKKLERGLTMKLPPYSVGFWVVPEAKVKICQVSPQSLPTINIETLTPSTAHKSPPNNLKSIEEINQFIVEKLKNPESESDEIPEIKIEPGSSESSEKEITLMARENSLPRITRRIRQAKPASDDIEHLKTLMDETQQILTQPHEIRDLNTRLKLPKPTPAMEHRIYSIAEGISDAMKTSNQQHEFDKFLEESGLKQDFGSLLVNDRRINAPGMKELMQTQMPTQNPAEKTRFRRSVSDEPETTEQLKDKENTEKMEKYSSEESEKAEKFGKKISVINDEDEQVEVEEDKNHVQDLVIPHQPDLKGLEDKYKAVLQIKLDDNKRKIDDLKKKIQEGAEISQKVRPEDEVADIQEEIIKKEIELISKAEETVADIFNNQKKRQETFEDLIFDELNDVKDEKIHALVEIQRNQKKKENSIHKRQTPTAVTNPLMKTVEYIEKNFNLEPESVRKIKRSLEEKMGELLRTYDTKKSAEGKKRILTPKEDRKLLRKPTIDDQEIEGKRDRKSEIRNSEKDKTKEKNYVKKQGTVWSRTQPSVTRGSKKYHPREEDDGGEVYVSHKEEPTYRSRKTDEPAYRIRKTEESTRSRTKTDEPVYKSVYKSRKTESEPLKSKKSEDIKKKMEEMSNDSFELFNAKKFEIPPPKKSDRRQPIREKEEKPLRYTKKTSPEYSKISRPPVRDMTEKEVIRKPLSKPVQQDSEEMEEMIEESEEIIEEPPKPAPREEIPLKLDKDRRANMLKQISSMVENINSMEKDWDRSKRMNYDEDISTEFEPDRKPSGIKRRPREADNVEFKGDGVVGKSNHMTFTSGTGNENVQIAEPIKSDKMTEKMIDRMEPVQPVESDATVPTSRLSKYRKLRKRPSRRMKLQMKEDGREPPQKKRHLVLERPLIDLDKLERKKIFKPKLRKINPKFFRVGNDLAQDEMPVQLMKDEDMTETVPQMTIPEMIQSEPVPKTMTLTPKPPVVPIQDQPKELLKDLEEIIEEQHFLGQGSEITKEESKTNGGEYSGTKDTMMTENTPKPTEDSLVRAFMTTESDKPEVEKIATTEMPVPMIESTTPLMESPTMKPTTDMPPPKAMEALTTEKTPKDQEMNQAEMIDDTWSEEITAEEIDKGHIIRSDWTDEEDLSEEDSQQSEPYHRERRATFAATRREQAKPEEDYSSEERIKRFKQMVYRRGGASGKKTPAKNEIRSFGSGLGADEFLKMAGSTVRVVFDDVIPEAYGQTKTKIQNMGLSEYIKEFGNLVQQMRNLDQIFLNIGEAAIKGYIRGNKAEKGPYIQVISRKKREVTEPEVPTEIKTMETPETTDATTPSSETVKSPVETTQEAADRKLFRSPEGSSETEEPTFKKEKSTGNRLESSWNLSQLRGGIGEDVYATSKAGETVGPKPEARLETGVQTGSQAEIDSKATPLHKQIDLPKNEMLPIYPELPDLEKLDVPENMPDDFIKTSKPRTKPSKDVKDYRKIKMLDLSDIKSIARDTGLSEWLNSYVKDDLRQNISPWIKTTKDFIQQALTTLQRQRQLSEILARDGVNLLKGEARKNIEKRDTTGDEPSLPVFHMIKPTSNKKRETEKKSDESLIRHLRGLQPGVYVVPTEEMTNVRSEQITKEARQKSGMPNVVTLNIYYDKKTQDDMNKGEGVVEAVTEPRISQDTVTYYQNKGWNSVASHYDQNNQFVSPMHEVSVNPPLVSPVYPEDPRIAEMSNSRMIQYPTPMYHYPPTPKIVSTVVPSPHPVYGPVMYVQPETTYVPQPPGTKRHWREFRVPGSSMTAPNLNSGWHLQYGSLPTRKSPKSKLIPSFAKVAADKKRSISHSKMNPTWSETALPFWKFFTESSDEQADDVNRSDEFKEKTDKEVTTSAEDIFAENRKRAKEAAKKMTKVNTVSVDEEKVSQEKTASQSRRKRSLDSATGNDPATENKSDKKLDKRSYSYPVEFEVHDILPQWFGTYQEVDNALDELPPHIRRTHIMSTPWSDEEEELLTTILDTQDEFSVFDVDDDLTDDYYIADDNMLTRLRRNPRSTNSADSAMLKTNMIFKSSMENDLIQKKISGMKSVNDKDSSLEVISKPMSGGNKMNSAEIKEKIEKQIEKQIRQHIQQQFIQKNEPQLGQTEKQQPEPQQKSQQPQPEPQVQSRLPQQQQLLSPPQPQQQTQQTQQSDQNSASIRNIQGLTFQQLLQPGQLQSLIMQNLTDAVPPPSPSPNDDTLYYFFKYAYDSFVKVMKSMTKLF